MLPVKRGQRLRILAWRDDGWAALWCGCILRAQRDPARQKLADLFVMIVIFMTYVGMLESFFLNRADPLWLLFALAVLGLELASRLRTKRA